MKQPACNIDLVETIHNWRCVSRILRPDHVFWIKGPEMLAVWILYRVGSLRHVRRAHPEATFQYIWIFLTT